MREDTPIREEIPEPKLEFRFLLWRHAVEDFSPDFFAEQIRDADFYVEEYGGNVLYDKERATAVVQGKFSKQAVKELAERSGDSFLYRELLALHGSKILVFFPERPYFTDFHADVGKAGKERDQKWEEAEDSFFSGDLEGVHRNFVEGSAGYVAINQEREKMVVERLRQLPALIKRLLQEGSVSEEGWIDIGSGVIERLKEKAAQGREIKIVAGYGSMHTTLARSLKAHFQVSFKGVGSVMTYSYASIIDRKIAEKKEVSRADTLRAVIGGILHRYMKGRLEKYGLVEDHPYMKKGEFLVKVENRLMEKLEKCDFLVETEFNELARRFSENAANVRRIVPGAMKDFFEKTADCFSGEIRTLIVKELEDYYAGNLERYMKNLINEANFAIFTDFIKDKTQRSGLTEFPIDPENPEDEKRKIAAFCEEVRQFYEFPKTKPAVHSE